MNPAVQAHASRPWRSWWIGAIAAVCVFLLAATVFQTQSRTLRFFNLRDESNLAALWSGMLLLLAAMHCFDGWVRHRCLAPAAARAWLGVALALAALSFDEIGSLHERIPPVGDLSWWWSMLPFALVLGGLAAYGLIVLVREAESRTSALLIGVGFGLFGCAALQEHIEHSFQWPAHLVWIRGAVEEGTELLGMTILVWAAMPNTYGLLSRGEVRTAPVFEVVHRHRVGVLVIGLVMAPVIAQITAMIPPTPWRHGRPADWPAAALFVLALFATLRPFLQRDARDPGDAQARARGIGVLGWALALVITVGCASTILRPLSPKVLPLLAVLSAAATAIWCLDSRHAAREAVPAVLLCVLSLGAVAIWRDSAFASYLASQYVALAFYWVSSASSERSRCDWP